VFLKINIIYTFLPCLCSKILHSGFKNYIFTSVSTSYRACSWLKVLNASLIRKLILKVDGSIHLGLISAPGFVLINRDLIRATKYRGLDVRKC